MRIKPMQDIRIRTKLMTLGAVCVLGLVILERESVFTASRIKQAGDEMSDIWMNAVIVAEELNTATSDYRIKESRHAVTTDPKLMEALEQEMRRIRGDIEEKFEEYRQLPTWDSDQAFMDEAAVQCGFCSPGFIMSAMEILEAKREFSDDEIRKLMSGHLCRCTGYENIFRAVKKTMLRRLGKEKEADAV